MNPIYAWYFVLVAWTCCHFVATKHISLWNIKSTKIRRRENWARRFLLFYWAWHPSFIVRASSIAEPMVNKDELIKGYVIKAQNSISTTQTSHYPAFFQPSNSCFLFSTCFPLVKKKKRLFRSNRKPSTKNTLQNPPAPPANLGSCRPGPCWSNLFGDQKINQLSTLRGAVWLQAARLSSISTKSQGLKKRPLFFRSRSFQSVAEWC